MNSEIHFIKLVGAKEQRMGRQCALSILYLERIRYQIETVSL